MIENKGIQFFIATDKPLEKTIVNNFCPFMKMIYPDKKEINHGAKKILDLFVEINEEVKQLFGKHWSFYADILPFDLKNIKEIPKETIKNDIKAVLLDLHALRKIHNKKNLFDLIESWRDLKNAGPHTPIFDPIFIFNYKDQALFQEIKSKFDEFSCPAWPSCECENDLKHRIVEFMAICNHPIKYCLVTLITPEIKNVQVKNDVIEIILKSPNKVLNSVNLKSFAKIDTKTGHVFQMDKEKALLEISHQKEYGQWFSQELAEKAMERPNEYFSDHALGFGVVDTAKLKIDPKNKKSIRDFFRLQINNMIDMENILDKLLEQLTDDFKRLDIPEERYKIRPELKESLSTTHFPFLFEEHTKKNLAQKIIFAQKALEGKMVCRLVKFEGISHHALDTLNSLGLDETRDIKILPNTMANLARAKSLGKIVEVSQIRTVNGNLDLFKLPG
jgi:hypothetical protein